MPILGKTPRTSSLSRPSAPARGVPARAVKARTVVNPTRMIPQEKAVRTLKPLARPMAPRMVKRVATKPKLINFKKYSI